MNQRRGLPFFTAVLFSINVMADCPFVASDPNALSLASATTSTLQGLVDKKNACSDAFAESVNSVQGLPQLMAASQNPMRVLQAKRNYIMSEIGRALSDPSIANRTGNGDLSTGDGSFVPEGQTYLDYLYARKFKIEDQMKNQQEVVPVQQQEEARGKLVAMTSNLMSAASNALNDSNSACAKNVSKNFGSQILRIGLGALSAASPLAFAGAAVSGVTLGAGLLSQFVGLFQKMPPDALRNFEEGNDTLNLACLYHNIVAMSCSMKEGTDGGPRANATREKLKSQAKAVPHAATYDAVINSKGVNVDLQSIMTAVAANSKDILGGGGSGSFSSSLSEVFASRGTVSAKDRAEAQKRQFDFLEKYLNDQTAMDALTLDDRSSLKAYLQAFLSGMEESLAAAGNPIQLRSQNGEPINHFEIFKKNRTAIGSLLQKKITEVSGGSASSILSLDDAVSIHRAVNIENILPKIQYQKATNAKIKSYILEKNLSKETDWANLLNQIEQSDKALDDFMDWMKTNPSDFADSTAYKKKLIENAEKFKRNLVLKNGDTFEIKDKVLALFDAPLSKFQDLVGRRKYESNGDLFAKPFSPNQSQLSDFEKVKLLKELYSASEDANIQLKDSHLVNETRRAFEDPTSPLRQSFSRGISNMLSRVKSSPDRLVAARMAKELCGLAYSLPADGNDHAISDCRGVLPERMANMNLKREEPDCSYQKYLNEKTREDHFKTGIQPAVPRPESGTK